MEGARCHTNGIRKPITRVDGFIGAYIYEHEVIIVVAKLDF
jgi:hypothetical protein